MDRKIRVAVVGYGNIGKSTLEAIDASTDMECAAVVRRSGSAEGIPELAGRKVVSDIREVADVDVAILATPSRKVRENALKYLALGINTVDSFDIHSEIVSLRRELDPVAKAGNAVSVIAAGWDPGSGQDADGEPRPKGHILHQFRSRQVNGTFRGGKSHPGSEGRAFDDHTNRHGTPPQNGLCRA